MSFTDLGDATAFGDQASGTTVTFSTAALGDVQAGDLVLMFWQAALSALTVTSVTDNGGAGQVYDRTTCVPKSGGTNSFGWVLCKAKAGGFGTTITITLSGAATFRNGTLLAFHASNGNPSIDAIAGSQNDTASPVDTTFTGTLAQSDELAVACWGWRGTAGVASGFAQTTPAGWTHPATYGQSLGAATRTETPVGFNLNLGAATTFNAIATFTSLANSHSWLLTFKDLGASFGSQGISQTTFTISRIGAADASVTVDRGTILQTSSSLELHCHHMQNDIRGKPNGSGLHNSRALAAAIVAANQIFDGHATHSGYPTGPGWQLLDPTPYGGYSVGSQVAGATLNVDNGTHFPAGGSTGLVAKVHHITTRVATTFTFTGVTSNQLTGCSGLPATIPAGSIVMLYQMTGNGTADRPLLFDNNQSYSVKELFDLMTGTTRTLVTHGCSTWMNGQANMNSPPQQAYIKAWAWAHAEICAQFAAAGTPLTDIGVWNEFKGFTQASSTSNQGGTGVLQNGLTGQWIPSDAGAAAALAANYGISGYMSLHYQFMYNEVYDAIKNHPNAAVNSIRVLGPHIAMGPATSDQSSHLYPLGSSNGSVQASGFLGGPTQPASDLDKNRLCYFLDYSPGFDGLTIDWSIIDNNNSLPNAGFATEAFVYAHFDQYRDIIRQCKSLLANRPGLSAGKRAAPLHFIEYYADVNLGRVSFNNAPNGGGFSDLQQGYMEASILKRIAEEGASRAYKWHVPDLSGTNLLNQASYWLWTQSADAGATRLAAAIVGLSAGQYADLPGDTLPAFDSAKIIRDTFPVGTPIFSTTTSDSKIWAMASPDTTIVANGYNVQKDVQVEGSVVTVNAYSLVAVAADLATAGEILGSVPI